MLEVYTASGLMFGKVQSSSATRVRTTEDVGSQGQSSAACQSVAVQTEERASSGASSGAVGVCWSQRNDTPKHHAVMAARTP